MGHLKRIVLLLVVMFGYIGAYSAEPVKIKLWPDGAPTKNGHEGTEEKWVGAKVYEVSDPELWIYPAKKPNGLAVIAAPGGGYKYLSTDNEGTMWIDWMNTHGITFAILKYRTPNGHCEVPLEDGRQAMKLMREKASEFGVNKNEIGVMGSSAGGHFAATLATMFGKSEYRPDFQILLYPVISMSGITHKGTKNCLLGDNPSKKLVKKYSLENQVTAQTPPAFIVLAADDAAVPPMNSILYARELQKNNVPYGLHIYPRGGHGFGFRDTMPYKHQWSGELERWLNKLHTGY